MNGLAPGINSLVWTVSNGTCSASDTVLVTNNSPTPANAGTDQNVCTAGTTLNGNTPTYGIGTWYVLTGNATLSDTAVNNPVVSNLSEGLNTFKWEIDNNGCLSLDVVDVTYTPLTANAGLDKSVCNNSTYLEATLNNGETGSWYTNGNAFVANPDSFYTEVTDLDTAVNVFVWTVNNGSCSVSDTVLITYSPIPSEFTYNSSGDTLFDFTYSGEGTNRAFYWNFGDGQTSNVQNSQHTYTQDGVYTVCLTVKDTLSYCQSTSCQDITVGTVNCVADFSYDTTGLQVTFLDQSLGSPQVWNWDYGDGTTSGEQNPPVHVYSQAGVYLVSLTIYDPVSNCMDTKEEEIKVGTIPCDAAFEVFVDAASNMVTLSNQSSGEIDAYFWNFGDNSYANVKDTSHVYAQNGIYEICLTVFNTQTGCQSAVCKEVQVGENQVSADFTYISSPDSLTATFQDASTGNITDWYWVFGDGTYAVGRNQSHTYKNPGLYQVSLQVLDANSGKTSSITKDVQVGKLQCNISADFSFFYDSDSDKVYFNDQSLGNVSSWYWQFGDGSVSTDASPVHHYPQAGYYLVSLSVQDATGECFDTKYEFMQIGQVECIADYDYTVNPDSLTVRFTDKSIGDIGYYYWEFGDGGYSEEASPSYIYQKAGRYPVFLAIADNNGLCADYREDIIQVGQVNCDAEFEYFVDNSSQEVNFNSVIIGDVDHYRWIFGDGGVSSEINPVHHYDYKGYYNVQLITYNTENNCAASYKATILVGDEGDDCEADFFYQTDATTRTVNFTDNSKGQDLLYSWNFGDGSVDETANPSHQYTDEGTKYVCLTVTNAKGISNMTCKNVKVGKSCEARFSYGIDSLTHTVTFTDESLGDPTAWKWTFGDDSESSEQNPQHTYPDSGNYVVYLKISNAEGCEHSDVKIVSVGNDNDTSYYADFVYEADTADTKPNSRGVAMFGTGKGDQPKAKWNFGDAQKRGYGINTNTLRPIYWYTFYGSDTTVNVCLTVEDPISGKSATTCHDVYLQGTTSVENIYLNSNINLYPNPATQFIKVQYSVLKAMKLKLNIYDVSGSLIKSVLQINQLPGNYQMEIPVDELRSGQYYLEFKNSYGKMVRKFVIQK